LKGFIYNILIWCAGSDKDILKDCPQSEKIKHAGYGTLVIVPAILALFAMTYALSTFIDSYKLFIIAGIVWSLIILSFDRFIISTFRKSDSIKKDIVSLVFILRFVFATFIGFTVAHPIVMLYFNKSISDELKDMVKERRDSIQRDYVLKLTELENNKNNLDSIVNKKEELRLKQQRLVEDEIDGIVRSGTTGIYGDGASAKEKKEFLSIVNSELADLKLRVYQQKDSIVRKMNGIELERDSIIANYTLSDDYIRREIALSRLMNKYPIVKYTNWLLIIFFIFIDILPITFKALTKKGVYDNVFNDAYNSIYEDLISKKSNSLNKTKNIAYSKLNQIISRKINEIINNKTLSIKDKFININELFNYTSDNIFIKFSKNFKLKYEYLKKTLEKRISQIKFIHVFVVSVLVGIISSLVYISTNNIELALAPFVAFPLVQWVIETAFNTKK